MSPSKYYIELIRSISIYGHPTEQYSGLLLLHPSMNAVIKIVHE